MLADNAFLSGADELAALKGAFIRQDVTGHGFIRSSQIPDALMELGRDPTNAAVILREFDPDGNGPVDFEQFIRIAAASLGKFASRCMSSSGGGSPERRMGGRFQGNCSLLELGRLPSLMQHRPEPRRPPSQSLARTCPTLPRRLSQRPSPFTRLPSTRCWRRRTQPSPARAAMRGSAAQ